VDDTNIICTQSNYNKFKEEIETILQSTNKWLLTNSLNLNFETTNFVQFPAKHIKKTLNCIDYEENYILNSNSTSFKGLILDDTLSWKPHTNQLRTKLKSACYTLRTLTPLLTQQNMKIIYFSYFHSAMTYGIILGGNSADRDNVFKLQKRLIRLITNSSNRNLSHILFKKLDILPLQSQYILSLALFVIKNIEIFTPNTVVHTKIP
jgi:hypothetical protein